MEIAKADKESAKQSAGPIPAELRSTLLSKRHLAGLIRIARRDWRPILLIYLLGMPVLWLCAAHSGSAAAQAIGPSCAAVVKAFLDLPSEQTLAPLKNETCWEKIGGFDPNLDRLEHSAGQGNRWSALYLARHLPELDGGNLEDALVALGKFSDHDMERLLVFANDEVLSKYEFEGALTMLPASVSDDSHAQLRFLRQRRSRLLRVHRAELSKQRAEGIAAIDVFMSKIQSKNPDAQ